MDERKDYREQGVAVPPQLIDDIVAARVKIEQMTEERREAFARKLGERHHTLNVTGWFLLHVLKRNRPSGAR